jgi:hypothetical protein
LEVPEPPRPPLCKTVLGRLSNDTPSSFQSPEKTDVPPEAIPVRLPVWVQEELQAVEPQRPTEAIAVFRPHPIPSEDVPLSPEEDVPEGKYAYLRRRPAPWILRARKLAWIGIAMIIGVFLIGIVNTPRSTSRLPDALGRQIEPGILTEMRRSPGIWSASIQQISLVHKEGKVYSGFVTATVNGERVQLALEVVVDGDRLIWQLKPW